MAARYDGTDFTPSSLPPPFPKSPPEYPDLHGKRREMAKIQVLEREINFLQAELQFVDGLQPASRSCKEIVDFAAANSDPLIPTFKKNLRRYHRFRKWLCCLPRLDLSRIYCCCCSGCTFRNQTPRICHWCKLACNWTASCPADCISCALPECLPWRPTTFNCLSCALPKCLQCQSTRLNCLSCALPGPLQWRPNLCCCCSCTNPCMSFGRLCGSFSLQSPKCSWHCLECSSMHPCCLPARSRSICNWACCFNLCS